jgi:hypothetical protein
VGKQPKKPDQTQKEHRKKINLNILKPTSGKTKKYKHLNYDKSIYC